MMEILMWVMFALFLIAWEISLYGLGVNWKHSLLSFTISTVALILWVICFA